MTAHTKQPEFTGRHMLIIMVAFFGVVIAVNLVMARLATSTWTGLVAKNGYVASIDYAAQEAAKREAAKLGWTVTLDVDGTGHVRVDARDAEQHAVPLRGATAVAVRDISRDGAREFALRRGPEGIWRSEETLPTGRWNVTARLVHSSDTLAWPARVAVEGGGELLR